MLNVFRVASDFGWSQDYWVLARNCRTIFQPLSSFFLLTMIASAHLDSWLPKEFKKLSFMVHYHFTFFWAAKCELVIWLTEASNLMHDFLTCGAHFLIHNGGNGNKDPTMCTALTRVFLSFVHKLCLPWNLETLLWPCKSTEETEARCQAKCTRLWSIISLTRPRLEICAGCRFEFLVSTVISMCQHTSLNEMRQSFISCYVVGLTVSNLLEMCC